MNRNLKLTTLFAFALAALLACAAGFGVRGAKDDGDDSEASKIAQGYIIAPVPLNLKGKNRALDHPTYVGSYLHR